MTMISQWSPIEESTVSDIVSRLTMVGIDVPQPNWHKVYDMRWRSSPMWPVYLYSQM